jgi:RNA methyltransferase, TrmH family
MKNTSRDSGRLRPVEGRHNALVKELRQAFSRAELTGEGFCAIEGGRIIEEAIRSGARFHAVFFSHAAKPKAERLLPQFGSRVETVLLPDKLFASAVPSDSPQGIAALVRWKETRVEDILAKAQLGPLLVIAGIQDPGNLGTIFRSAEAFGVAGILLGEGTVSPFNSKVVRASAGSLFRLPTARVKLAEILPALKSVGIRLAATTSHKGTALPEAKLSPPIAIFIGNEGAGVAKDLMAGMDEILVVPHALQVESLNAAIATSIVLYEASRQKQS